MKKIIFIIFATLLCFSSFAQQDWLCVYPSKKVYFEDKNKMVYCLRIDSTFNNDTILYPFSDLHKIGADCYSITSGSWLTKFVALNEDGNTIFLNGNNQQILIKNRAELNEIWQVYENENIKVKGKITSISIESVLGVEDSVKTISFSVYNKDDEPVTHILNQFSIEISKQFGLVKTLNFYYFEHEILDYWHHFGEFDLIGIDEPQLGFRNINLKEQYFDFQVGDEFHIYDYYIPGIEGPEYEYKTIHRYLSRTDFEDKIEYYYERKINSNIPKDTVKQVITKGLLFNTEPNELYGDEIIGKVNICNTPLPKLSFEHYDINPYSEPGDSCLHTICVDGCFTFPIYFPGLGGPYYPCCEFWWTMECYELVYYKKGDVEWGTPFNLSVVEHKKDNSFSIYPNPANNYISIKSTNNEILNNSIIEIYDIQGKKLLNKQLDNSGLIDISFLKAGYYIITLIQENKDISHFKLIKQ